MERRRADAPRRKASTKSSFGPASGGESAAGATSRKPNDQATGQVALPPLPARGAVEHFEDRLVAEFRAFTSLGEAAEEYIRHTFRTARQCSLPEGELPWELCFEDEACDSTQVLIADKKIKCSLQPLMSEQQQARWGLRAKARREQGLPAATARQMLFFILRFHHLGQRTPV